MSATNFKPLGPTTLANCATSAATVFVLSSRPVSEWLVTNAGANDVFFRMSTNAASVAAAPVTSGTSAAGQLINAGDTYIIAMPEADGAGSGAYTANITVSAQTLTSTSQLFITPVQSFGA